jgi:hypothetical protein
MLQMKNSKIYKYLGVVVLIGTIGGVIAYAFLSNRHKAIVKTTFLHKTGLVDNQWMVSNQTQQYKMSSPDFYVDGIYKSMEGPKASNYVQLSTDASLLWITGFEVKALDSKTNQSLSNDFICHTNVDFNEVKYYSSFGLEDRIGMQYPRMTSLSHGLENFKFPKGYGIPMQGNEVLYVTTQALNHNLPNANYLIKHEVTIDYEKNQPNLKPLLSKTVFIMLPYNKVDPYKSPLDPGTNFCIPVETKNHSYEDQSGNVLSGHWVIPVGKNTYRSEIDTQLQLKDSLRLHAAAVHVHPFATAITLFDKTTQTPIFKSRMMNHTGKIGLSAIQSFCSEKGIWLFKKHQYELILEVDNTSKLDQDMMGSMFLFFYDSELETKIATRSN